MPKRRPLSKYNEGWSRKRQLVYDLAYYITHLSGCLAFFSEPGMSLPKTVRASLLRMSKDAIRECQELTRIISAEDARSQRKHGQ